MSGIRFEYNCSDCGHVFEASGTSDFSYGEFIMRSENGCEVHLMAIGNDAFSEVLESVRAHPLLKDYDKRRSGDIAQQVYSIACDPDPEGSRYFIGMHPTCPNCGSRHMSTWDVKEPPTVREIGSVSNDQWFELSEDDRGRMIDQEVQRVLHENSH